RTMKLTRAYVRKLYNRFQATLVPSELLAGVLSEWGVRNVRAVRLGVNTDVFKPVPDDGKATRAELGITSDQKVLLYVGRLAREKNTQTLFRTFELLHQRRPNEFRLLVIGDGPQRKELRELERRTANVSWIQYCTESADLARYYRAADLFVHHGVQRTFGLVALEGQACGPPGLMETADDKPAISGRSRASAREDVRKLCSDTGLIGDPIDPVYEHPELFAAFLTTYSTDHEPESCFLVEVGGAIRGYLLGW